MGVPRELHTIQTLSRQATLSWLPPTQQRGVVDAYKLKFNARDGSQADETVLRPEQLSCRSFTHASITSDSLCHTITELRPSVTYEVQAQARSSTGAWSDWSPTAYFTTPESKSVLHLFWHDLIACMNVWFLFFYCMHLLISISGDPLQFGGDLRLVFAEPESLKVRWTPPENIARDLTSYRVSLFFFSYPVSVWCDSVLQLAIAEAYDRTGAPQSYEVSANQLDYTFTGLKPNTIYNTSVEGSSGNRVMWTISNKFQTADRCRFLFIFFGHVWFVRCLFFFFNFCLSGLMLWKPLFL